MEGALRLDVPPVNLGYDQVHGGVAGGESGEAESTTGGERGCVNSSMTVEVVMVIKMLVMMIMMTVVVVVVGGRGGRGGRSLL